MQRFSLGLIAIGLALGACGKQAPAERSAPSASGVTAPARASAAPTGSALASTACAELRALACSELGSDAGVCELLGSENAKMPDARCREMLSDRTQTLADFHRLEDSRTPLAGERWSKISAPTAPSIGPANAPITIVAFLDYDCELCQIGAKALPLLVDRYPGKVRAVVRQHPIASRTRARALAEGGIAAGRRDKFRPYFECVFNSQHDLDGAAARCARQAGLDAQATTAQRFAPDLERDYELGREALAGPVPYYFVNGKRVTADPGTEVLEQLVGELVTLAH